jgi:hypothetical protein
MGVFKYEKVCVLKIALFQKKLATKNSPEKAKISEKINSSFL